MRKCLRLLLIVVLLSLGGVTAIMPRAAAAPDPAGPPANCVTSGALACYYDGTEYSGTRGVIVDDTVVGPCQLGTLAFNTSSSLFNNSIATQSWWTGTNITGSSITVGAQSGLPSLPAPFNNDIKSWKGTCFGSEANHQ